MLHIDTLNYYERLVKLKFSEQQAKGLVEMLEESRKIDLDVIATKDDIAEVKQSVYEVKSDLKLLEITINHRFDSVGKQIESIEKQIKTIISAAKFIALGVFVPIIVQIITYLVPKFISH